MIEAPQVIAGSTRFSLVEDDVLTVPSGPLLLELPTELVRKGAWLNGRRLAPSVLGSGAAVVAVDSTRLTGFNELTSAGQRWSFATEDTKLQLRGLLALIEYLGNHGMAWSGAMFFSGDSRQLRDSRLDKAWIDQHVAEIAHVCRAIGRRPEIGRDVHHRRSKFGRPDVRPTISFLRQNSHLIEEHPAGPLTIITNGARTRAAPLEAIVRQSRTTFDTLANRRASRVLAATLSLVRALIARAELSKGVRGDLEEIEAELAAITRTEPFRSVPTDIAPSAYRSHPTVIESYDPRYAATYRLAQQLIERRCFDPTLEVLPQSAYVGYSDQIFQQFCAHMIASARGLQPVVSSDHAVLAFENAEWLLLSNVKPPATVLTDWRDSSERPSDLRPDLVAVHKNTRRSAVLDAKYRNNGLRASPSALSEVQLYMQAYGLRRAAVLYPLIDKQAPLAVKAVKDDASTFLIAELPIRPGEDLLDFVSETLWEQIEELAGLKRGE